VRSSSSKDRRAPDDIGDHRLAEHIDAGRAAADQLDAVDLRGRDAIEHVLKLEGLVGDALAVDHDIAGGFGHAAQGRVAGLEGEARQAPHHVERAIGVKLVEIAGGIGVRRGGLARLLRHAGLHAADGQRRSDQARNSNIPHDVRASAVG
jgi:hypothetical protein